MGNGDEAAPGGRAPAPAQPGTYDQTYFLDLAAKGKDEWNVWRRDPANKYVYVTFEGVDFSEAPKDKIDFSGFDFGDGANFSGCKWRGVEWFEIKAAPKAFAPGRAFFAGASFNDETRFSDVAFGGYADFSGTAFGHVVHFTNAAFGDNADFADAAFGDYALFSGATFGYYAVFVGASFDHVANFKDAVFNGRVDFTGKPKEQRTGDLASRHEMGADARTSLEKRYKESGPDRFLTISFANAHFGVDAYLEGEAIFSGRSFEQIADFTNARFYFPPIFDNVTNAHRIDFTGAHVGFARRDVPSWKKQWTTDTHIPVRLRAFRKVVEETKNHDLERDLYIEERKAERGVYLHQSLEELKKVGWIERPLIAWRLVTHFFWMAAMLAYLVLANYGRNFLLPAFWLGLSVPFFYFRYKEVLAPLMHSAGPANADKYNHAVWMLAFGNAVPFVGPLTIDAEMKRFLFCPGFGNCLPMPPEGIQFWVVLQNIVSIILVFFIGLALRNYFKIK